MLPFLAIATAGLGAVSAGTQLLGAFRSQQGYALQAEGAKEQAAAQLRAEKVRKRQMLLDFRRSRREVIRQGIVARSQALATAVAQGADGDSSATSGQAGVTTQVNRTLTQQKQNRQLGLNLFAANLDYYRAGTKIAEGGGQVAVGQGIASLGASLGNSIGPVSRLGTLAFGGA